MSAREKSVLVVVKETAGKRQARRPFFDQYARAHVLRSEVDAPLKKARKGEGEPALHRKEERRDAAPRACKQQRNNKAPISKVVRSADGGTAP